MGLGVTGIGQPAEKPGIFDSVFVQVVDQPLCIAIVPEDVLMGIYNSHDLEWG
jgi:hypothetical protein